MSIFKSLARGGMVVGALVVLNGCSSEELVGNKYEAINKSEEIDPKKTLPKEVKETSIVIARVMNPKVLLKKTLNRVEDLIGKAHFKRREGNALVLQYKKDLCILDIFFYGREGQQQSTYYEFRSREETNVDIPECINKMVKN
jgi:hypothetical protein